MRLARLALVTTVVATVVAACGTPAPAARHARQSPAPRATLAQPEPTPTPVPSATPFPVVAKPATMVIPSISVRAAIEHVGFLDVPRDPADVAWFGTAPGASGTATFDGHLDWIGFKPAVFWDLAKVRAGDEIDIVGEDGTEQRWVVDLTQSVPYTSQPPDWLYASSGPPRISIITCAGTWTGNIYSDRLLVRAVPRGSASG